MKIELDRYQFSKPATALRLIQIFSNWPVAFWLWLCKSRTNEHPQRLLKMRSGLNFVCRESTSDWNTIMELLVADEYRLAFDYVRGLLRRPLVVDLGANVGLFSLMCARAHHEATVLAYEPAPPNCDQFDTNLSLNNAVRDRIQLRRVAVGPKSGCARLSYEDTAPASANVYGSTGKRFDVEVVSLKDVLETIPGRVHLLKIDIEGAEYDLLRDCEGDLWAKVDAIALELHDDPFREMSRDQFLSRMEQLGFYAHKGPFISLLLTR